MICAAPKRAVREAITAQIARGKVECRLSVARGAGENEPELNPAALQQLAALASQVARTLPAAAPISTADVLNWPGVVETPGAEPDILRIQVLAALAEALAALAESRQSRRRRTRHCHAGAMRANRSCRHTVECARAGLARGG